jgi:hypothetical protein
MTKKIEIEVEQRLVGKLERDDYYESPNEWGDTSVFLVFDHRQFQVDRPYFKPRDIYDYINYPEIPLRDEFEDEGEFEDAVKDWEDNRLDYSEYYIFNLSAYIHGSVSLSLGREYPFNDRWDTSSTGFVLVSKKEVDFALQRSSNEILLAKTDEEIAEHYAKNLVETWNTYLEGDVWTMSVELQTVNVANDMIIDSEHLDSCGGYYGLEHAEEEMMSYIEYYKKENPEIKVVIKKTN